MLNVGLTGGIASGKSTVARMLADEGAVLIDLDALAHRVQAPGGPVWSGIVRHFGEGVLNPDRTIDRRRLGEIVFADPERLALLNRLVHPAVFALWRERLAEIRRERPEAIVLSDIPLLFEVGLKPQLDLVILVYLPPEEQIRRLMERGGLSRTEAERRLSAQLPIAGKLPLADIVIRNEGAVDQTRRTVRGVWQELLREERRRRATEPRPNEAGRGRQERLQGGFTMIEKNVATDFSAQVSEPVVDPSTYVHPLAAVIGNVRLGKNIMVAPTACIRGDEGQPLYVGDDSNVQDGVVIHALETETGGEPVRKNLCEVDGGVFAVHVGKRVSLAHQAQIHGPAVVGDDTFIGMQSLVFRSRVGSRCVVEPGVILMGVRVAEGRYVPAGSVVRTQAQADALPSIGDDYPLKDLNRGVVHVNTALARGYLAASR
jgi:carbonic anhydrase